VSEASPSSYDEVPYESHPFHQTHPRQLASVATLFGLAAPPPERARILELGAASGGNLASIAESLPESSCLGIDLSSRQVADGRAFIAATGLRNAELRQASILDVDASYGQFDYIVCHGVYSWVDRATQQRILQLCRERLSENGVAYVSYNTYPGWHMKGMLREMMKFHAGRFKAPAQKIEQSRALLEVLAKTVPAQGNPYGLLLQQEAEAVRKVNDGYIFHEHLEDHNDPCYFHEFVERCRGEGLQFLGEAELRGMLTSQFPEPIQAALREVGSNVVYAEQYMDFFRNRTFRQTLLCHEQVALTRRLDVESFRPFSFASPLRPLAKPERLDEVGPLRFGAEGSPTAAISGPIGKVTMLCLGEAWPEHLPPVELEQRVRSLLGLPPPTAQTQNEFLEMLWNWFTQGIALMASTRPAVARKASDKPRASAVARAQVRAGQRTVSTLLQRVARLSDADAKLLALLDGSLDRSQICAHLPTPPAELEAALGRLGYAGLLLG